jgi:acyl-CoA synthetase (AMP-forming)/AMP-acid ligase II
MDLGVVLEMVVAASPDRVAITGPGGDTLTTSSLQRLAGSAAVSLADSGAEHIGYCGVNGCVMPVALFGAALAGLPFVPLNYRLSDEQLVALLARQPIAVVASGDQAARLRALGHDRVIAAEDLMVERPAPEGSLPPIDADAVAVVLYTSGTTSAPKAALLRHRHLAAYVIGTVEFASMAPTDAVLVSVPPYHIAGIMNLLSNLYAGRRIVYLDPFDPVRWLETAEQEGVTHAMVVPTMLARIVDALGDRAEAVPTLRSLSYGGAPMPLPVIERALQLFPGVAFSNAYGLTETSSTVTVLGPEEHRAALSSDDPAVRRRLRSAGRPMPGVELEVRDELDVVCAPGEVGEIHVRGEQVAGEYASGAMLDDGWFPTRDRGFVDADGYLFIEGRADDTIIRGGENIAPAEIEEVLLRHPAVADCAVVGVEDEEWGQRVAAAVVMSPGAAVDPEDLAAHAREHLRSAKTPDLIVFREELPYSDTGKLLRRVVRQDLTEVAEAGVAEAPPA